MAEYRAGDRTLSLVDQAAQGRLAPLRASPGSRALPSARAFGLQGFSGPEIAQGPSDVRVGGCRRH